jgi:S1-C subfamily serine protease
LVRCSLPRTVLAAVAALVVLGLPAAEAQREPPPSFARVVAAVAPAVVTIAAVVEARPPDHGLEPEDEPSEEDAQLGAGVIVDPRGVVADNTVLAFEAAGLAFTIPSNTVRAVTAQLIDHGRVSRPWLGVLTQTLTSDLARALPTGSSEGLLVAEVIACARACGRKIGICGQAPSDYPEFARFLVRAGIDSISLNPDALVRGLETIAAAERDVQPAAAQRPGTATISP